MSEESSTLADIPGLMRVENPGKEELTAHCMELTHAVYPHHQVYGQYCTIHEYVGCPRSRPTTTCARGTTWRSGPAACGTSRPPAHRGCGSATTGSRTTPGSTARWSQTPRP